nr:hypothetical protein [Tanacetum cinerariifolium]
MDLCGPMRMKSINGKRYVLVIMDDYSHYTWVHFLRSKDEAPEEIKTFLKKIKVLLQAPVIIVRTDNDTKFKNQVLQEYFNSVGISHQASSVRTPQQNGVVERRNRTLVEAARTMAFCYPKNDHVDIRKLGAKCDISFFIGYSTNSHDYSVYNRRTKKIIETINVTFDELSAMAFEQSSLKPRLQSMTSGQISSRLDFTYALSTISTQQLTKGKLDLLFDAMYGDYISGQQSAASRTDVNELKTQQHHVPNDMLDGNTFVNPFATPSTGTIDPTLFIRRFDNDILVVQVYVHDIIFGYTNPSWNSNGDKDKLDLDQNGSLVDATKYPRMIGALMYLTSSRPDIVHATCLCARYQAKPTKKHLKETFKSTSGGAQFLGEKLIVSSGT